MKERKAALIELLESKKIPYEVIPHKRTFTAADEAATLHVPQGEVLKTIVLDTGRVHVVVVLPASRNVDMALVRDALSDSYAHLAREAEMQVDFAQFELGSIPPVPSLAKVPVYVDPEVMQHPVVIFAADQEESVRVKTEDLFGSEYVTVTPLAWRYAEAATDR
jgi:Ala-tRNA(Pro) deacylase